MNITPVNGATSFGSVYLSPYGENIKIQSQIAESPDNDKFERAFDLLDEATGKDSLELRMYSQKTFFNRRQNLKFSLYQPDDKKEIASATMHTGEKDLGKNAAKLLEKLTGKYNKIATERNKRMK